MADIYRLSDRITLIDGYDLGMAKRTGSYVIQDDQIAIIETSASPSVPFLLEGLKQLGISSSSVQYLILTHIHLDHAGGAGLFLQHCPNAKVIVHEKGARHLEDPSRLISGAKAVYGKDFNKLFDSIIPVPKEKIIIKKHEETLSLSPNSQLVFYDTPGHANHHLGIYDSLSNGIFAGDTAGVFYPQLKDEFGIEFYLPSTSPNQFNPDEMLKSISLFEKLMVDKIYFGHFGVSENPKEVYRQVRSRLPWFISAAEEAVQHSLEIEKQVAYIYQSLLKKTTQEFNDYGIPSHHLIYKLAELDLNVSAMGLADYINKRLLASN